MLRGGLGEDELGRVGGGVKGGPVDWRVGAGCQPEGFKEDWRVRGLGRELGLLPGLVELLLRERVREEDGRQGFMKEGLGGWVQLAGRRGRGGGGAGVRTGRGCFGSCLACFLTCVLNAS